MMNRSINKLFIFWVFFLLTMVEIALAQTNREEEPLNEHQLEQLNKELLIGYVHAGGQLDTINLINIINGTDQTTNFISHQGDTINYLSFQNKVVLLDFWFLDCRPCIVELPGIGLINKKITSPTFDVITFAIDPLEAINATLLRNRTVNYKIVPEVFLLSKYYPLKILTNKKAQIIDYKFGGNASSNSVALLLEKYLPLINHLLK